MAGAVRPPAVAGRFYPADAAELAAQVDRLLAEAPEPVQTERPRPAALVVPHAGYACSGPIAATAYRRLAAWRGGLRSVVLVGPAHFRDVGGLAVSAAEAWATPLGPVPVDAALRDALLGSGLAHAEDAGHAREHALEVQLPFLQRALAEGWTCLPVAARSVAAGVVADALDLLATDGVLVVVSTDLSHYLDAAAATTRDGCTAAAIRRRDPAAVDRADACGAEALRGLLAVAGRRDLAVEQLALATSAETCSGPGRVVGYGAFAFLPSPPAAPA